MTTTTGNKQPSKRVADIGNQSIDDRDLVQARSLNHYLSSSDSETDFGYYAELSAAKCEMEFKQLIADAVGRLGFDDFAFARFTEAAIDPNMLITQPPKLSQTYFDEDYHRHDMILQYVDDNKQPIFRSQLYAYSESSPFRNDMQLTMRAIHDLCKSYGFYDFYHIPFRSKEAGSNGMFSVTSRGCNSIDLKRMVRGSETTLKLLCEAIDFVSVRKFPDTLVGKMTVKRPVSINPRPLRVLDLLANSDLNISQVADKLCISVVTANKHLDTIRKALGVKTNHAAIREAVINGIIRYRK